MEKKFVGQEYMAATNGKGLHQQSKGHRILSRLTIISSTAVTIISVMIVAFCVFFHLNQVNGPSMMTTLNATGKDTDSALTCTLGEPAVGDIVIMKFYIQNNFHVNFLNAANGDQNALNNLHQYEYNHVKIYQNYNQQIAANKLQTLKKERYVESDKNGNYELIIKRLIGKPGDKISMHNVGDKYYLYLNGAPLDESYLDPVVAEHNAPNFKRLWYILNGDDQADLHDWVTTNVDDMLSYNPDQTTGASAYQLTVPDNYYFVLGDNRGSADSTWPHSWDSSAFGPLPISSYTSRCVDILPNETTMAEYLWDKFVYYVCFGWAWQKWNPRLWFFPA